MRKKLRSPSVLPVISGKAVEVQRNCLNFLNRKARGWTRRQQKCFLFSVCMVMGGLSTLSLSGIGSDVNHGGAKPFTVVAPFIRSPIIPNDVTENIYYTDTLVFYRFRKALDSLRQTSDGRKIYEDFIRQRPGFFDSLTNAEKLFKKTFHY